jgi:hypothetical protein
LIKKFETFCLGVGGHVTSRKIAFSEQLQQLLYITSVR